MRRILAKMGGAAVLPSAVESKVPVHRMLLEQRVQAQGGEPLPECSGAAQAVSANFSVEKTVTLAVDEAMQEVCYQIMPSPSSAGTGAAQSPAEEDVAINFILA